MRKRGIIWWIIYNFFLSFWRSWDHVSWYISIAKPTRRTICRVYWIPLYMFWTVFPSIIRSSILFIKHQVYVIQVCWLHTSGHEMELLLKTTSISCPLAWSQRTSMTYLMLYVQSWTLDDRRKDRPKHAEWYSINSKNCSSNWF